MRARASIGLLAFGLTASGLSGGATPDAWADYVREVKEACVAASGLRGAKVAGKPVEFDDRVGVTAVVIDGRYPQPHMKNRRGRVLCLFDKKTRMPFVSEANELMR